jgi:pimeloyl-ACP methyl ester carboxylesterase
MRAVLKWLSRLVLLIAVAAGLVWVFAPREDVTLSASFEPRRFGEGIGVYFEAMESRFDDITPDTEKRVIWAGQRETRTAVSVVYIHGFSATSQEIRPVPDRIAEILGANLVFTRLQGHGRKGNAMGGASVQGWMQDTAEALAAGRATGNKVVVIATSTGATLAAAAALDPEMSRDIAAMILVSPNFGINDPSAWVLTLPGARWVLPRLLGPTRSFEPANAIQAKFWTTSYPLVALLPMAALVQTVVGLDFSGSTIPALFWLSDDDRVVRADIARQVAARWGGPVHLQAVTMGPGDSANSHVIAGDALSPGQTDAAVQGMVTWLRAQGIGG